MLGFEERRNGIFPIARTFCGICFIKANPLGSPSHAYQKCSEALSYWAESRQKEAPDR
jgi:hypothetical protein